MASKMQRERAELELAVLHLPTTAERKQARVEIRLKNRQAAREVRARAVAEKERLRIEDRQVVLQELQTARANRAPPKRVRDKTKEAERKRLAYAERKDEIAKQRADRRRHRKEELGVSPTKAQGLAYYDANREEILERKRAKRREKGT